MSDQDPFAKFLSGLDNEFSGFRVMKMEMDEDGNVSAVESVETDGDDLHQVIQELLASLGGPPRPMLGKDPYFSFEELRSSLLSHQMEDEDALFKAAHSIEKFDDAVEVGTEGMQALIDRTPDLSDEDREKFLLGMIQGGLAVLVSLRMCGERELESSQALGDISRFHWGLSRAIVRHIRGQE